jgi:hypothetical protein
VIEFCRVYLIIHEPFHHLSRIQVARKPISSPVVIPDGILDRVDEMKGHLLHQIRKASLREVDEVSRDGVVLGSMLSSLLPAILTHFGRKMAVCLKYNVIFLFLQTFLCDNIFK